MGPNQSVGGARPGLAVPEAVSRTLWLPSTRPGGKLKENRLESRRSGGDTSSSSQEEKLRCSPSACRGRRRERVGRGGW